jgi:AcrR family transcriptional regulator
MKAKVKNAYMKKKDPLFVRESLLNAALELAATKGMADVTVNKVSELAHVTKGAVFHHFDSKETLVTELMRMLLGRLDLQFDRLMADERNVDGCFTRAYVRAAFSEGPAERKVWGALLSLMASKDEVGSVWGDWLSERLKRHSKTDSRVELRVVRLAADGVWLERIMNAKSKSLKGVEESLIEMTRLARRDGE